MNVTKVRRTLRRPSVNAIEPVWGLPKHVRDRATSLETRAAILDLLARYAWGQDTGDADSVAALCTEDFEYISSNGIRRGRTSLIEMITTIRASPAGRGKQHWVTNSLFVGDGELCFVRSMGAGPQVDDGVPRVDFVGFHDDLFASEGGRWLFKRRIWRDWRDGMVLPPMNDASDLLVLHQEH
jgi:hypothetical protein